MGKCVRLGSELGGWLSWVLVGGCGRNVTYIEDTDSSVS